MYKTAQSSPPAKVANLRLRHCRIIFCCLMKKMATPYKRTGVMSRVRGRPVYQLAPVRKRLFPGPATGTPVAPRMGRRVRRKVAVPNITKQRRQRKVGKKIKTGDNSSYSFCEIIQPWNKPIARDLYKQICGRQTRLDQWSFSRTCGVGKQAVVNMPFMVQTQLVNVKNTCAEGSTSNDVRCFLGTATQRVYMRNQSNSVAKVMIYDLLPKRDSLNSTVDDATEAWDKGYTDMGLTNQSTVIGTTPNLSPEFRHFWRIHKVTTVNLEAGEQHDHTCKYKINKLINSTRWDNSSSQYFKGISAAVLIVFHGTLVHESATPTTVTFTDVRLDYAVSLEYSFGYIKQNLPSYTNERVFGTSLVDGDMMGETGDADVNPSSA